LIVIGSIFNSAIYISRHFSIPFSKYVFIEKIVVVVKLERIVTLPQHPTNILKNSQIFYAIYSEIIPPYFQQKKYFFISEKITNLQKKIYDEIIMKKIFILFLCAVSVSAAYSQTSDTININIAAGIPTKANDTTYYLIERPQYVVSISKILSTTNWAAWHLCKNDFGNAKRYKGKFITDSLLPNVKNETYTNSGYDRGHLVRSYDRTKSDTDNKATFYLTNIIPQTPALNRGVWLNFERYCQTLCQDSAKHLFIVAGGTSYTGKKIKNIAVADSCWKVVLILDSNKTLMDIDSNTQTIAVLMPNTNTNEVRKAKWNKYLTTVDKIEASTGYDFFNALPESLQTIIESKVYKYSIPTKKQ
jgi:endonuclease G